MNRLPLLALIPLLVACGDDRHYAHLVVRTKVLNAGAPVDAATVKLITTPSDGAHSSGKESAAFTLKEPIVLPCDEDDLDDCSRGVAKSDRNGIASLMVQAPEPRKDYESDEEHPEREAHPGRFAKAFKIEVTQGEDISAHEFAFEKDEPLWRFHRVAAPEQQYACTFDSDYTRCTIDVTVNVP